MDGTGTAVDMKVVEKLLLLHHEIYIVRCYRGFMSRIKGLAGQCCGSLSEALIAVHTTSTAHRVSILWLQPVLWMHITRAIAKPNGRHTEAMLTKFSYAIVKASDMFLRQKWCPTWYQFQLLLLPSLQCHKATPKFAYNPHIQIEHRVFCTFLAGYSEQCINPPTTN